MKKAGSMLFLSLLLGTACKKETCKQCYLVEAEGKPIETTMDIGMKCGDELDEVDGKVYIVNPEYEVTRSYCE